jgi:hypothetical protein
MTSSLPHSRPDHHRGPPWLPALVAATLALGLAGCGGDSPLKEATGHTTKANAALDAGDYPTAMAEWKSGMAVIDAHRDDALPRGTLGDRGVDLTKKFQQKIHGDLYRMQGDAGKSRAALATVTDFVQACASAADQAAWADTKAEITQGFNAGDAGASAAVKAGAYLLWTDYGDGTDGSLAQGWVQGDLVNLLKNGLGGNVVPVATQPGAQEGIGSAHLVLVWSEAQYQEVDQDNQPLPGTGRGPGYSLPQSLSATLTITTRGGASKHDGTRTWKVSQPPPRLTGDLIKARQDAVTMLLNKLAGDIQASLSQ